ncbi:ATP-binding protein [Streptomyces sp. NPDC056549]|uniref:ATP-binding protein n=1 Tax=Streptomyces sp. NPDC056549 TaxID=3345864 RepID=UPI0036AFEBB2
MPPTAAELISGQDLGQLVSSHVFGRTAWNELAWVRETIRRILKNRIAQTYIDDTALIATELLTNASRHASGAVSLTLDVYDRGITVGVADRGVDTTAIPTAPTGFLTTIEANKGEAIDMDDLPESGQGLYLISALATAWGIEPAANGKLVTAVLALAGSDE